MTHPQQNTPDAGETKILDLLRRLGSLYIDNIRLTSAEKLTIMVSGASLVAIIAMLGGVGVVFLFVGFANLLESYGIASFWSYFIIAALLFIAMALIVLLRDALIVNPIARFISRLILNPPKK